VQYRGNLFRLDAVQAPPAVPGRLRLAELGDWELLADWAVRCARAMDTHVDLAALFARMLRRGGLYVWDNGGARCVVGESGNTPNGTRINAVFTPEEFRNRGYARNAVAAVSERALRRGSRFCVLFAEEGLERVYERLGYRSIRDHVIVELRSAADQKRNV
jgi:predicted GNAT family acetyltransferase